MTLFSIPKPFRSHTEIIQRNAIQSWTHLQPHVEIILLGDDEGTGNAAKRFGLRHLPTVARNDYGTPLLSDVLEQAEGMATRSLLCYVNADIILMEDFLEAVRSVVRRKRRFLLAGRRWDIDIQEPLSFAAGWEAILRARVTAQGQLHPPTGIDYFVYPRKMWGDVPPFAIGRTVWDNWLVYRARALRVPVVDATEAVMAVHQNHDYSHVPAEAVDVWVGPEAERNMQLAGGWDHVFTLQDATHVLTPGRLKIAHSRKHLERHLETMPRLHPHLAPLIKLARGVLRVSRIGRRTLRRNHMSKAMGVTDER